MKIYINFMVLMAACITISANAQLVIKKDAAGRSKTELFIPESKIITASSKIKQVTIAEVKKPHTVTLDPLTQLKKARENCPLLIDAKTTLELQGERRSNESVMLEWKTKNGYDNLGFDIERSFNDTLQFEKVNYVWAKNISGIKDKYTLPDNNDYNHVTYYRLRLAMRNGEYYYSNIAKVGGYTKERLSLYPNPASADLFLNITNNITGIATIKIFDVSGKIVWQQSPDLIEGLNVKTVKLNNLASGAYTVRVDMADKTFKTAKFIKK